jgi:hypothetical protein
MKMTPEQRRRVKAHNAERDAILLSGDIEDLVAFYRRNGGPPLSPEAYPIMFHKVRTAVLAIPIHLREESKRWLYERGMTSYDDGELGRK